MDVSTEQYTQSNLFTDSCAEPTGVLEFESAIHLTKSSSSLKKMRMEGFLCDIVLVANCDSGSSPEGLRENEQETRNILAHRVVLACACPYFSAMFRSKMTETVDSKIHIRGVSADILQLLVDFMYTGKVLITEENVQSLLQAADLFGMVELCEACCNFLKSHITTLNCLGIKTFAEHHNCVELAQCVREYIERHFNDIMESDEFCQQSAEYVMELFSSDHLRVPLEERVFEALIRWVRYDECNRRSVLPKLFEKVRLSHVSLFYLFNHVVKDPLVLESLECSIHVINSLRNVCLKEEGSSTCVRPRVPYCSSGGSARGVIVVGGQAPKAIRNVDFLDFKSSTWKSLRELPMRRCRCGVVCLENFVYAVGGFNGSMRVRNVDVFDVNTNTWSPLASLEARRSTLGVGELGGRIYAIGGFDGSTGLSSAEVYDPRMKDWRFISPMSTKRSSVGVAVLNDLLFAVGGYDGDSHQCLQTVECYEPRMDRWISLVDMSCRRSGPGVVTVGDKLYVVGGHDGPQVHNSVEVFDMMQSRWMPLPDMSSCRRNAGVCAVDNVIYSMGGDDGYSNLKSVEKLEIGCAEWKVFLPSMPISRSYAGVTLVEQGL